MKISFLTTSSEHPVFPLLQNWVEQNKSNHEIDLVLKKQELKGGDVLFLISCHELIEKKIRDSYQSVLILHASDLPKGRGWSPHIWDILNGKNKFYLCLLETEDAVDSGKIWKKVSINLTGDELFDEINDKLFAAEFELVDFAVKNFGNILPKEQNNSEATYYPRRKPEDSELDTSKSIASQFNLMRVSDPVRYPTFFSYRGAKYRIVLNKINAKSDRDDFN